MAFDPKALADGGLAVVLLFGIAAIVVGAIRGDWVPGWIYRAAIARAEKAEAIAALAVTNVEKVTDAVKSLDERANSEAR